MTEPAVADDFEALLHAAAQEEQRKIRVELLAHEVSDRLRESGVSLIWHPDSECQRYLVRQATTELVVLGCSTDDAQEQLFPRYVAESTAAHQAVVLRLVSEDADNVQLSSDASDAITTMKRELLTEMYDNPFLGERWCDVLTPFLDTPPIDFNGGEQFTISAEMFENKMIATEKLEHITEKVAAIILADVAPHEVNANTSLLIQIVVTRVLRAGNSVGSRANTEEYLRKMLVTREAFNEQQFIALQQLIDEIGAP